jgi:methionyl-tRNA formyltransferase
MKKVYIATSREVGDKCQKWAHRNIPPNCILVEDIHEAGIVISVLYDKILPPDVLRNKKCFNFHPGVLPEYRGSGAFSWCLINQEKKAGVTLHLIDKGIDTGDIIEIREFLISRNDTAYSLHERGQDIIYKMFKDWFNDLINEDYKAVPQCRKHGHTYFRKDLEHAKNLTKYVKAFYFPGKESAYYLDELGNKKYITFKG